MKLHMFTGADILKRNEHCAVIVELWGVHFWVLKVFMVKLYQYRYPNEGGTSWVKILYRRRTTGIDSAGAFHHFLWLSE